MASPKSQTKRVLREFVYEDLDGEELSRELKDIERRTSGANPHNIGMAASSYLSSSSISGETEREAKKIVVSVFPTRDMKRVFAHDFVEEVKDST
ncbi:hypothetical protein [Halorubrum xinjiangense]|uniref:hypothetical protein n=1 Tax=Halorubrum xinjiangense TaxID=261291 RepID=UPI00122D5276|nr:hypothetical protein [Halorubrum xinjiangense]